MAIELPWLQEITHAKATRRLPIVLTRREIDQLLAQHDDCLAYMGKVILTIKKLLG